MKTYLTIQYPQRINDRLSFRPVIRHRRIHSGDNSHISGSIREFFGSRKSPLVSRTIPRVTLQRRIDRLGWHDFALYLMCITHVERMICADLSDLCPGVHPDIPGLAKMLALWICAYPGNVLNPKKGLFICCRHYDTRCRLVEIIVRNAATVRNSFLDESSRWMIPESSAVFSKDTFLLSSVPSAKMTSILPPDLFSKFEKYYNILDL